MKIEANSGIRESTGCDCDARNTRIIPISNRKSSCLHLAAMRPSTYEVRRRLGDIRRDAEGLFMNESRQFERSSEII